VVCRLVLRNKGVADDEVVTDPAVVSALTAVMNRQAEGFGCLTTHLLRRSHEATLRGCQATEVPRTAHAKIIPRFATQIGE